MAITNGLIDINDARAILNIPEGQQTDINSDIERYIEAATPVIENITGPILPRDATYVVSGGGRALILPTRFREVVSITVDGNAYTGYSASPDAGVIYADITGTRTFAAGARNVSVIVKVGQITIPPNVVLAARELVRHLWQVGRQGTRPAWGSAEAEGKIPTSFAVPNRVLELLQPNEQVGGFA